jgi:pyrimidine-nucleoside phosphorylase
MAQRQGTNPILVIQRKRDGAELSRDEIVGFVSAFVEGKVADYQMSAMLMAMFLRGMSDAETVSLMEAMLHSGKVMTLDGIRGPKVDKHSTGGVGDKVSICLAPLVAACGVFVPMISGRGLGHTGGTLDKLASIAGFRTEMDGRDFERIVRDVGACLIGQTAEIAPADKLIYALRDVTATVESIPLIVASILSKKLAEGIDGLVLDVKVGRGAFMQDRKAARKLAETLVRVGTRAGKRVVALITDMSSPLAMHQQRFETREALDLLAGQAPICSSARWRWARNLLLARVTKAGGQRGKTHGRVVMIGGSHDATHHRSAGQRSQRRVKPISFAARAAKGEHRGPKVGYVVRSTRENRSVRRSARRRSSACRRSGGSGRHRNPG